METLLRSMLIQKTKQKYDLILLMRFISYFFIQGKWELLSKAQSKKVKTRYEEEKRKQIATADREVKFRTSNRII